MEGFTIVMQENHVVELHELFRIRRARADSSGESRIHLSNLELHDDINDGT